MAKAKFAVGDHVNHPAAKDGSFPAGTGTIETVNPDGTYKVRCDATSQVLAQSFAEADLSAC